MGTVAEGAAQGSAVNLHMPVTTHALCTPGQCTIRSWSERICNAVTDETLNILYFNEIVHLSSMQQLWLQRIVHDTALLKTR